MLGVTRPSSGPKSPQLTLIDFLQAGSRPGVPTKKGGLISMVLSHGSFVRHELAEKVGRIKRKMARETEETCEGLIAGHKLAAGFAIAPAISSKTAKGRCHCPSGDASTSAEARLPGDEDL